MSIIVYNITKEEHFGDNVYYIGRGSSFGNPYTHIRNKETKALVKVKTRDEAIDLYSDYFDALYRMDESFRGEVDSMYMKYKSGIDIYLGCYCSPMRCHGDIIKEKLERRLIKEKIAQIRDSRKDCPSGTE